MLGAGREFALMKTATGKVRVKSSTGVSKIEVIKASTAALWELLYC